MFNMIQKQGDPLNDVYVCLSTDTKPTDGIGNGDVLMEIDTGKVYLFDADGKTWTEFGG